MKVKYLIFIALAILLIFIGSTAADLWKDYTDRNRLYTELLNQKEAYEQISKNLAKLEIQYKSEKDFHEKAKKDWSEISKAKDERIKLLSDATYIIGSHVERQNGPDYFFNTKKGTKSYILNELRIQGEDSPPIGYIMIKSDGRTYKKNYDFEIQVKNLQTIDEKTGKIKFYAKAFLVQKEVSTLKKRLKGYKDFTNTAFPIEIKGGTVLYDPTFKNQLKPHFMWTRNLNGGVNIGSGEGSLFRGTLGVSFSGYGPHEADLTYKILQLGVGIDSQGHLSDIHLIPISMRPLPKLLKNTYLGPGIGKSENKTIYFLNLSTGF